MKNAGSAEKDNLTTTVNSLVEIAERLTAQFHCAAPAVDKGATDIKRGPMGGAGKDSLASLRDNLNRARAAVLALHTVSEITAKMRSLIG